MDRLDLFAKSRFLAEFAEKVHASKSLLLENIWETPKALLAALALKKTNRSILLLTGGVQEDRLFTDLSFFLGKPPIEFLAWETLPGEEIAPSKDILGERFKALHALLNAKEPNVVLCPLHAFLQKILLPKTLSTLCHKWSIGARIEFQTLPKLLMDLGYAPQPVVTDKGQFAMRGSILDLFPASSSDPFRIEFFDDTIETIRTFDPIGQKSIAKVDSIFLVPADELAILQKQKEMTSIREYLKDPILFWDDLLLLEDHLVALQKMPGAKSPFLYSLAELLPQFPQHIFCSLQNIEDLSSVVKQKEGISFTMFGQNFSAARAPHTFQKIDAMEEVDPAYALFAFYGNEIEKEEAKQKLSSFQNIRFMQGVFTSAFALMDIESAFIPSSALSNKNIVRRQKWRSAHHTAASDFHALVPGDLVVHFHSGIGKYLGMEKQKNHLGVETEFLILEYAEQSKLFVPISQAYLVSRYIGSKESAPILSELGSKRWQKIRDHATAQIVGYANDLLQRQAERVVQGGFRYAPDSDLLQRFEKDFPYEETEDQIRAITDLKHDMTSHKPMDRLICGDVGYGKTEVAMRAAFKAVVDGQKQVAILVPTTVLAMQHFETFSERMRGFPVRVDVVSRFRSAKQAKETLKETKLGNIDILIGTHRLLSKDVQFKDLGLIIIDEEQRFGVRAKEHLKKFKVGVDCLTLSATPIPRTLYMSLVDAREMSVISTPPQDRLPIKTVIAHAEFEILQNALLRELARGGQAFFIHNRVETIFSRAEEMRKLVPTARIAVVHGQMDPDDIDQIFHEFKQGKTDLLCATTIIESGIDIPNANTILIDRADTYGLADLYQLRGRVGRWNRSAYAYFLIPRHIRLSESAQKRLNALAESSGYGGGMKLAMRDLEIRGAGDILGVQQSGQVSAIGFHLYCKLLKRAIDSLKAKKPIAFTETKMEFSFAAYFPDGYVNDISLRMELYNRLGDAISPEDVDLLFSEIQDRFGKMPPQAVWLYHLSRIRVFAAAHHFTLLKFGNLSFTAEQQKGKEKKEKTLLMPKNMQAPKALEEHVIQELQRAF